MIASGGLLTLALAVAAAPPPAPAVPAASARTLELPLVAGERPTFVVAQRVIDRQWGPSDDSVYVELEVPGWRSESGAAALSFVLPGAGQAYVGDRLRGVFFLVAEATGWILRHTYDDRGHELRTEAESYAGVPTDSSSTWSFARWAQASGDDPAQLEALYRADPHEFYHVIGDDPRFLAGWTGNSADTRAVYGDLQEVSQDRLRGARYASTGLWVNHVVAALDALRCARLHNLPLRENLDLRLKSGWHHGGPTVTASLEGRF